MIERITKLHSTAWHIPTNADPLSGVEMNGEEVVVGSTRQDEDCARYVALETGVFVNDSTQHTVIRLSQHTTNRVQRSAL